MARINSCVISDELTKSENIIEVISGEGFIARQITELKSQYVKRNIDNTFIGVIVWDVPFHKNVCQTIVQTAFSDYLALPFDLGVIMRDKFNPTYYFLVEAKK